MEVRGADAAPAMRENRARNFGYRLLKGAHIGFGNRRRRHGDEVEGHPALLGRLLLGSGARLVCLLPCRTIADDALEPGCGQIGKISELRLRRDEELAGDLRHGRLRRNRVGHSILLVTSWNRSCA
jgi:hypothetical protein